MKATGILTAIFLSFSLSTQPVLASAANEEDESAIVIYLAGNLHMVVTDPKGRRVGYDPNSKTHYKEIEAAQYSFPESIASAEDDSYTTPESSLRIEHPLEGSYSVKIMGDLNQSSNYTLSKFSYTNSGDGPTSKMSGVIGANQIKIVSITHKNTK